jgi:hypothetical protein
MERRSQSVSWVHPILLSPGAHIDPCDRRIQGRPAAAKLLRVDRLEQPSGRLPARSSHVDVPGSRHLGSMRYTPHMPHRRRTGCVLSVLASKIQTWSHMASASRARRYCSESSRNLCQNRRLKLSTIKGALHSGGTRGETRHRPSNPVPRKNAEFTRGRPFA